MAALPTPWPDAPAPRPRDESFGALVRRHRQARSWSQERLAEAADIEVGTVRRIEAGRHRVRPSMMAALGSALGMEAEVAAFLTAAAREEEEPKPVTAPVPVPSGQDFGALLRRYRLRSGHSQNSLAKVVSINASYVNRMESGERESPTREVALALARALALAPEEIDRLLFSAGHVPPSLQKLGIDSTVNAVIRTLTNDRLSPETRADLRACIETMCARWSSYVNLDGVPALLPDGASTRSGRLGSVVPAVPSPRGWRADREEAEA